MTRYRSPFQEFFASVRRVGLSASILLIAVRVADWWFDFANGVDTYKRLELSELQLEEKTAAKGQMYQPTGVLSFRRIMKHIRLPERPVFLDFGSGKGRTLLLAAQYHFERVIGVEFSRELCDVAEANLKKFNAARLVSTVSIECVDAARYVFHHDENVFYFFYPFNAELMRTVMGRIEESLSENPRSAVLIYYYPVHRELMTEFHSFHLADSAVLFGYECLFYEHNISR